MNSIKNTFRSLTNGSQESFMSRSKEAESIFHNRRSAPSALRDTLKYAEEAVKKYCTQDGLNIELFSFKTQNAKKQYRKKCQSAVDNKKSIGFILDMPEKDHFDFCVIHSGKSILGIKDQAPSYSFNDNCYVISDDAFMHLNTGEDVHFQGDQMSCAFFAAKHTKSLLKNNGELFEKTIFDKKNHQCYPHPEVFKYSQSNSFLENYKILYNEKLVELKENPENAHLNQNDLNFNALDTYRNDNFNKHRMLYFCAKYFHESIRKPILKNPQ